MKKFNDRVNGVSSFAGRSNSKEWRVSKSDVAYNVRLAVEGLALEAAVKASEAKKALLDNELAAMWKSLKANKVVA